jgi:hypothetical protein
MLMLCRRGLVFEPYQQRPSCTALVEDSLTHCLPALAAHEFEGIATCHDLGMSLEQNPASTRFQKGYILVV